MLTSRVGYTAWRKKWVKGTAEVEIERNLSIPEGTKERGGRGEKRKGIQSVVGGINWEEERRGRQKGRACGGKGER